MYYICRCFIYHYNYIIKICQKVMFRKTIGRFDNFHSKPLDYSVLSIIDLKLVFH
jgi:hypothetical protein